MSIPESTSWCLVLTWAYSNVKLGGRVPLSTLRDQPRSFLITKPEQTQSHQNPLLVYFIPIALLKAKGFILTAVATEVKRWWEFISFTQSNELPCSIPAHANLLSYKVIYSLTPVSPKQILQVGM